MENYFKPTLSEEQLAAYLDGMLTSEENSILEEQMTDDPAMLEIQDSIDAVDAALISYDEMQEIPLECQSDNFELPVIDSNTYNTDEDAFGQEDEGVESDTYYETEDNDYQAPLTESIHDDGLFDDMSF